MVLAPPRRQKELIMLLQKRSMEERAKAQEKSRRIAMARKAEDQRRIEAELKAKRQTLEDQLADVDRRIKIAEDFQEDLYVGTLASRVVVKLRRLIRQDAKNKAPWARRFTIAKLSRLSGINSMSLYQYTNFKLPMPVNTMDAIMCAMNISVLDLIRPDELASVYDIKLGFQDRYEARKARALKIKNLKKALDMPEDSALSLDTTTESETEDSQLDSSGES